MNLLAPLFALGALAIAGPIIFHLIRRTTRDVTPFSTLMFLSPTPPRVTKRSRLENLWLLLLRCLVLALLALGFARPFLAQKGVPPAQKTGAGRRLLVLLDTSASLRREQLWAEACKQAGHVLRETTPADEAALLTFDRTTRPVFTFDEWTKLPIEQRAAAAVERLAAIQPGWAGTHLDAALLSAVELADEPTHDGPVRREIVIISDFQEGAHLDALQGYSWPKNLIVTLLPIRAQLRENTSLQWISEADEPAAQDAALRLRVSNAAESKQEQFKIRWADAKSDDAAAEITAYVPAGQARMIRAPKKPADTTPTLTLTGDQVPFDNTLYVLPPQAARVPVLFLGPDADEDPRGSLYYLRRAFPKTAHQAVEVIPHRLEAAIPAFQLQQTQLIILGEPISDAALASARQFARAGHVVLAPLTSPASAAVVARLCELPAFATPEATVKDYALLARIDFAHPVFAPFADPRYSDFTKIHIWKYRRLDPASLPGARILAALDNGDPAIVQVPLGAGSVVVFTTSWRPADSQWALSSKFVPLLNALLDQSSNLPVPKSQYFVGDDVAISPGAGITAVRKPDGAEAAVTGKASFAATDQPGIYSFLPGGQKFVVNLAPEESRMSPLTPERFAALGVPLQKPPEDPAQAAAREVHAAASELESRQKLWRWCLAAAVGLLLLETLFAGKLSGAQRSSTTVPS